MRIGVLYATFVACVWVSVAAAGQSDRLIDVLPRDAIPAIDRPTFEPVAKARGFDANELMIGLVGADQQRAYSTWQLDRHEIVNEIFDGKPVAVTW